MLLGIGLSIRTSTFIFRLAGSERKSEEKGEDSYVELAHDNRFLDFVASIKKILKASNTTARNETKSVLLKNIRMLSHHEESDPAFLFMTIPFFS